MPEAIRIEFKFREPGHVEITRKDGKPLHEPPYDEWADLRDQVGNNPYIVDTIDLVEAPELDESPLDVLVRVRDGDDPQTDTWTAVNEDALNEARIHE